MTAIRMMIGTVIDREVKKNGKKISDNGNEAEKDVRKVKRREEKKGRNKGGENGNKMEKGNEMTTNEITNREIT